MEGINYQNQLRHSRAVVQKFLNRPASSRYHAVHRAITDCCDFERICIKCPYDDFGYCGLRNSDIYSDFDVFTRFCAPSFLKYTQPNTPEAKTG